VIINAPRAAQEPTMRAKAATKSKSAPSSKSSAKRAAAPKAQGNGHAPAKAGKAAKTTKAAKSLPPALAKLVSRTIHAATKDERPYVYVNGQYVPKGQAMVSVYDHGLLYGDGVFEGIRIYNHKIFKCQSHMDRLYRCASQIHLAIPTPQDEMVQIMRNCVALNGLKDGYIRLVVTRGFGTLGLDPRRCPTPGIICIADQIALYPEEAYERGMRVIVAKRPKTPRECLDPRIKSLNYLNNILAKVEAIMVGCDEAIMLSTDGQVTECTGDNIFVIKDGIVFTPPNFTGNSGSLEGITQKFVRDQLIPSQGLRCIVKDMTLDEVLKADEVFLTGTAAEIIGVNQIDDHRITQGEGPITHRLRQAFRQVVTSEHVPED
jgi:branched-chain amino acid aminotransferase